MNARATLDHILEIALAGFLLWLDIKYFLFFSFVFAIFHGYRIANLHRATASVFQFRNHIKLVAILNKLGITDDDLRTHAAKVKNSMTTEEWDNITRDFIDLK